MKMNRAMGVGPYRQMLDTRKRCRPESGAQSTGAIEQAKSNERFSRPKFRLKP
jgi:hypothetical protein